MLSKSKVEQIVNQSILVEDLSDDELADFCVIANQSYRDGKPIISYKDYDFVFLPRFNQFFQTINHQDTTRHIKPTIGF